VVAEEDVEGDGEENELEKRVVRVAAEEEVGDGEAETRGVGPGQSHSSIGEPSSSTHSHSASLPQASIGVSTPEGEATANREVEIAEGIVREEVLLTPAGAKTICCWSGFAVAVGDDASVMVTVIAVGSTSAGVIATDGGISVDDDGSCAGGSSSAGWADSAA
jgi:hypothetical protein